MYLPNNFLGLGCSSSSSLSSAAAPGKGLRSVAAFLAGEDRDLGGLAMAVEAATSEATALEGSLVLGRLELGPSSTS